MTYHPRDPVLCKSSQKILLNCHHCAKEGFSSAQNIHPTRLTRSKDSWAVITDEIPSLQTLRHYSLRFCVEELFLDSKSGAFGGNAEFGQNSTLRLKSFP